MKSHVLGRPSFNSIQRYLLKSSVQLRISKNFQLPPPAEKETPAPEKEEKRKEEEEVEEPVTPRRKLVPAQHKIEKELKEMRERENELALIRTRSYKSTPNLTAIDPEEETHSDHNQNHVADGGSEIVITEKNAGPSFETKDRKRSTLIHQWENKIQAGN
jgi:hypothetical protein